MPPDLQDDLAFAINSYNWTSFGTWEHDPHRRAAYLGDVDFFNRELAGEEEDEDEEDYGEDYNDEDEDDYGEDYNDEDEDEDDGHAEDVIELVDDDGAPAWDAETQPPDISGEKASAMEVANSELDQLTMWNGLAIQLRESSLAQGRPATPPATPMRSQDPPPSTAWNPWPLAPPAPPPSPWDPWPLVPHAPLPPPRPVYQLQWQPEIIDLVSDDEQ